VGLEKVEGWISNPGWNQKKMLFLLFINRQFPQKAAQGRATSVDVRHV
jgi:hypothetical protein